MKRLAISLLFPWIFFTLGLSVLYSCKTGDQTDSNVTSAVHYWITTPDKSLLLSRRAAEASQTATPDSLTIKVDTASKYQSIDGFGFALTGGSASLLHQTLTTEKRKQILKELFGDGEEDISVSYLRISIGASDLDASVFSYNDMPAGKTDPELKQFSIDKDRTDLIPVLREILAINPTIKIMGSPWSAPAWMKTNNSPKGGSLKKDNYPVYAAYFVKYIDAMRAEGITIDAVTLQNEPENPHNNPSMLMTAEEQAEFVKNHLGPAFEKAGINTKIIVFDHNGDHPEYPITVLNDVDARKYIDGSAFHLYLGEITALSKVHDAHPDRNLYFTEQWTSGEGQFGGDLQWHTRNLTIGAMRNWSKTVIEWNLANDPKFGPHTEDGGCTLCLGALTIFDDSVTRNVSYYVIAHASKFIPPGSVRIGSNMPDKLPNVAFMTQEGKMVVLVMNEYFSEKTVSVNLPGRTMNVVLPPGAIATVVH